MAALLLLAACATPQADDDRRARALEPSLRQAAAAAESANDFQAAASYWSALYERSDLDADLLVRALRSLRYSGQAQVALVRAEAYQTEVEAADPRVLLEKGKALLALERPAEAIAPLETAAQSLPQSWEAWSTLGVASDYLRRFDRANEAYRTALDIAPGNPAVLNNHALSLAQQGRIAEAIDVLDRASAEPGLMPQIRMNQALLAALKGDPDMAEEIIRDHLPDDVARYNAAYFRLLAAQAEERRSGTPDGNRR